MKKYLAYIIIFAVVVLSLFFYINSDNLIDKNKTEDVGIRYYNDLYKAEVLLPADWKMVVSEYDGKLGPIESNDWDYVVFVDEELKTEVSFHYHDNEKTSWSNEDVFAAALDLFNVYERNDYEIVDIKISGFDAKKIYKTNSVGNRVVSLVIINTNEGILKVSLEGDQEEINRIVDSINFKKSNSLEFNTEQNYQTKFEENILNAEEGSVYVKYNTYDSSATLIATDKQGRKAEKLIAYGVDEIFKYDSNTGFYFVVSTNRENERIIGFDLVSLVRFTDTGPIITDVISESGFGEFYQNNWFFIPQTDRGDIIAIGDLEIYKLDANGEVLSKWSFGKELVSRPEWKEDFGIMNTEISDSGKILVDFVGTCGTDEKFPLCAQYILDVERKEIILIENKSS